MHSLQALALMQENRIASEGSLCTRIQRSPSSTDWPRSNGTAWVSQRPSVLLWPRQIFRVAVSVMQSLSSPSPACGGGLGRGRLAIGRVWPPPRGAPPAPPPPRGGGGGRKRWGAGLSGGAPPEGGRRPAWWRPLPPL